MPALTRAVGLVTLVLVAACNRSGEYTTIVSGGNPDRGRGLIRVYGCGSCHTIPGVRGAESYVGPNLDGIASRSYIAGVLPNDPENMVRWIRNPPAVDAKTAMPFLGVSERDARDIAAYLYRLKAAGE
ncbi:MAG TPA: c-type cytochrome [Gemmatimonadaceae bacterium]|nr:c-type cytochrome [Gemmatimonadaceae bacterium]